MGNDPLKGFLAECAARVDAALESCLPPAHVHPTGLHEAMRYAALGGGKRIRPALIYGTGRAIGIDPELLDGAACAIELIHAYSLVHDDLPAMDDDDLRRGRPTCHKAFDEATAILAGDALQTLAFHTLTKDEIIPGGPEARLAMVAALAAASGSRGMAGGQALDLESEGRDIDLAMLEHIHIHKTGTLIRAGVQMATLAEPQLDAERSQRLDRYAKCLGLAFQIQDDILDVEGETAVIGKTSGKDQAQQKATYPALMGLDSARQAATELIGDAIGSLEPFGEKAEPLRWIAGYMVERDR
jgi:farnesyl diphosphate synthase